VWEEGSDRGGQKEKDSRPLPGFTNQVGGSTLVLTFGEATPRHLGVSTKKIRGYHTWLWKKEWKKEEQKQKRRRLKKKKPNDIHRTIWKSGAY